MIPGYLRRNGGRVGRRESAASRTEPREVRTQWDLRPFSIKSTR